MVDAGAQLEVDHNGSQKLSPGRPRVRSTCPLVLAYLPLVPPACSSRVSADPIGTLKRSPRQLRSFVQAGDSIGRPQKAGRTDHAVEQGSAQEPPTTEANRGTGYSKTPATAADGLVAAAKIPPWDPIKRYWSDRNSFPDYGTPGGATMGRFNFGQSFLFGNFLNNRPEASSTTPKRVNESPLENPPKRLCVDDDAAHDVLSMPSGSGLPGKSIPSSSSQRKGAREAPSLRSSDRSANGVGLDEYRSTEQRVVVGKHTRQRRRDKARRCSGSLGGDGADEYLPKANSTAPYKSRNHLVHRQMTSDDPIQDDEEDIQEIRAPVSRKAVTNGRSNAKAAGGNSMFTSSAFEVSVESEDELGEDQRTQTNSRPQRQTGSASQVRNGRKRPASSEVDDETQVMNRAKRQTQGADRADMHRTTFGCTAAQPGDQSGRIRVIKAVCGPTRVYSAEESVPGCVLVPSTKADLPFEAVNAATGKPIAELWWLTPKASKVTQITQPRNSMTVKISKRLEPSRDHNVGATLYLQLGNAHEADQFVSRFCNVTGIPVKDNLESKTLEDEMTRKLLEILKFNEQKTKKATEADVQYLEHKESVANRSNSKSAGRSAVIATPYSQPAADKRPIRAQMRVDDSGSAKRSPYSKVSGNGPTSMTPEQRKQLQEVVGEDSLSDSPPRRSVRNEKLSQTPSRLGTTQTQLRPQRSLRSAGPKPKSPSPEVERWTEKNPTWADSWKIDLVYERTVVGKSDVERLDEGQLLNDEIITFYLKYLHKQLEERDAQLAQRVYFFNSFFWEKLKPKRASVNYDGVKNWTAKVDLLSFDYIIVPINEHAHWYVAIVCNAKQLLSSHDTSSETDEPGSKKAQDQAGDVAEDAVSESNDTIKKIAVDVSHISIDDDQAETTSNQQEEERVPAAAKKTKVQRKGIPRKYDPKAVKLISLDSLGGAHPGVSTAMKVYLQHEIEAKKGLHVEVPASFGMSARNIPTQPNFTDCGVYLLGYMREFMKDPDKFATNILQREERTWDFDAPTLRNEIRDLIFTLQKDYQRDQIQQKRERLLARRQMPKSQESAKASVSPFRYSDEPAVRGSPAPQRNSADNSRQATPRAAEAVIPRAPIDEDVRRADTEPPSAGDTPANIHNESMIVNVDESIEHIKAPSTSGTSASKPVESIELDDEDAPPPAAKRTPSTQKMVQGSSAKGAASPYFEFVPQLPSSSPQGSPTRAESLQRNATQQGSDPLVKTPGSYTDKTFAPKSGVKKHRLEKTEVIPSSSEEETTGKESRRKKGHPTIDLTKDG
ncbi:hypothetical protein KVR01_011346 [Diaporthe batatas]|uniref:SUMO protease ULP2 n=1 Tax=Diaporthe batatas TaxID=748121 RepID=UPI001D04D471|nr:SUMO protease ULP2 [Diaporthe batatas]KAG8158903.1 hypothetical protein KVR01_011346 [Diaporthe batatas]